MDSTKEMTEKEMKERKTLINNVAEAFRLVYKNDKFLIENELCERCIMFRFAQYLADLYPDYDVDCEYNRHKNNIKKINANTPAFPDVIMHTRGIDDNNFAVIELKNKTNKSVSGRKNDETKLQALTKSYNNGEKDSLYNYGYKFGLAIDVCENLQETMNSIVVYRQGEKDDKK